MKIEIVAQRDQAIFSTLLEIWETSVAATHNFLTVKDIRALKSWVFEAVQSNEASPQQAAGYPLSDLI